MNESLTPELDRVAFQQVWRRVMPEDRPDCPFTLEAPTLPTVTSTPVPVVSAAPPSLSRMAPTPQAQTCLGESSAGALPFLREMLAAAAEGQRTYRGMARQSRRGSSLFSNLAAAKAGQGKRLSTAFFLIAGKEPPAPQMGAGISGRTLPLTVRTRYHAEQGLALRLEEAAQTASDPCLAELYRAMAGENRAQADRLRGWLEEA